MFKHILFDADNTLFDFDQMERNAFFDTMNAFLVPCDDALYNRYRAANRLLWLEFEQGRTDRDHALAMRFTVLLDGMDIDGAAMNQLYQHNLAERTVMMPYAKELCERLSQKYVLSIVTNGVGPTQRRKLDHTPLEPYFTHQFISEEVGVSKPDVRFFEHVFATLGNPARDTVLIVGDSLTSDMQGGMNAGISTCWLNREGDAAPEGYRLDYEIRALEELAGILLE